MLLSLVSEAFSIGGSVHLTYHLQWVCLVRDISLWTHRDTTDSSQGFSKSVLESVLSLLRAGSLHWIMALEMAIVTPWGKQSLGHWRHVPRKDCGGPKYLSFLSGLGCVCYSSLSSTIHQMLCQSLHQTQQISRTLSWTIIELSSLRYFVVIKSWITRKSSVIDCGTE